MLYWKWRRYQLSIGFSSHLKAFGCIHWGRFVLNTLCFLEALFCRPLFLQLPWNRVWQTGKACWGQRKVVEMEYQTIDPKAEDRVRVWLCMCGGGLSQTLILISLLNLHGEKQVWTGTRLKEFHITRVRRILFHTLNEANSCTCFRLVLSAGRRRLYHINSSLLLQFVGKYFDHSAWNLFDHIIVGDCHITVDSTWNL